MQLYKPGPLKIRTRENLLYWALILLETFVHYNHIAVNNAGLKFKMPFLYKFGIST